MKKTQQLCVYELPYSSYLGMHYIAFMKFLLYIKKCHETCRLCTTTVCFWVKIKKRIAQCIKLPVQRQKLEILVQNSPNIEKIVVTISPCFLLSSIFHCRYFFLVLHRLSLRGNKRSKYVSSECRVLNKGLCFKKGDGSEGRGIRLRMGFGGLLIPETSWLKAFFLLQPK